MEFWQFERDAELLIESALIERGQIPGITPAHLAHLSDERWEAGRTLCDERLDGLRVSATQLLALARLMADLPRPEAVAALEGIQANRADGDPVCGWPSFLAPWETARLQ